MAEGQCIPSPDYPCRVNMDLLPREETWLAMVLLTVLALAVSAFGFYQMVQVWRKGAAWKPGDWKRGLARMVSGILSHRKFMQDRKPGTMHAWIFFGFFVLFLGTVLAAVDMDIFEAAGMKLLFGRPYLVYEAALDAFGVVLVLGVLYAFKRRYQEKPPQLHRTAFPERPVWKNTANGDLYALVMLLLIALTGFILEGMRLQYQTQVDRITYAHWSFVGNVVAWAFNGWTPDRLTSVYPYLWWFHFALWTSVLAVLPWTKFKHIVTSSLNLFFHDDERQARADLPTPFSLQEAMAGDGELPNVGYATIRDFTWKDRLALDACTNCGRCEAQCPAYAAGRPLSPRKLIQDLKAHMWQDHYAERAAKRRGEAYQSPRLTDDAGLATQIEEATLWSCTTCRACMTECPVDIEHVDMIVEMRRAEVMASKLDEHQQKLLVNITNAGNPYGFPAADRFDWKAGLPRGVQVPTAAEKRAAGEDFDTLWWVGCVGSYDPRNQEVTRAVATILNAAGVDFAVLGTEERCNGDPARRLGEEGRFQQSVLENLATLQQYGVTKIITQCPHCFNTFLNEYPEFGGTFEVEHHTTLIERLLEEGKIPLKEGKEMKIAYHDSCYLGRHNGIFDAPRNILKKTQSGLPVLEMAQNREQGLCCGAGGSNMWYEVGEEKERINVIRARQAAETGADTVASACPFCLTMLKDGVSLTGNEGSIATKDIAEIVLEHLDWEPPEAEAPETPGPSKEEPGNTVDATGPEGWGGGSWGGGGWGG